MKHAPKLHLQKVSVAEAIDILADEKVDPKHLRYLNEVLATLDGLDHGEDMRQKGTGPINWKAAYGAGACAYEMLQEDLAFHRGRIAEDPDFPSGIEVTQALDEDGATVRPR